MEDRQLNFNQPLLSVRRNFSTAASQKVNARKTRNSVPLVPQLPSYGSELKSEPIRNPGAVPFQWEQTPGQPKEVAKRITMYCDRPPIAPKLPPGRFPQASQDDSHHATPNACESGAFVDNKIKNFESCEELVEERANSDSGDSDESYVDAPATLSRTESFFINCSVSGLSGFDELGSKPSESFLIDPRTREFMMDRFLPAAKAMASETPEYTSKKEPAVVRKQEEQSKKIVGGNRPLLRYGPSFAKRHSYCPEKEEDEEENDDDYDQHQNLPAICGLLPRFCLKSSFGLLNPVPAMSLRTRVLKYAPDTIQPRASSVVSYSENDTESKSDIYEVKSVDKIRTPELNVNSTSGHLENHNTSTCHDTCLPSVKEQYFLGIPDDAKHEETNPRVGLLMKGYKTFQELLADQSSDREDFDLGVHVHEKTLYVDTMKKVVTQNMSCHSLTTQVKNVVPDSEQCHEISIQEIDRMESMDTSHEAIRKVDIHNEEALKMDGFKILSAAEQLNPKGEVELSKAFGDNQDAILESTTAKSVEVANKESSVSVGIQPPKVRENTCPSYYQFPIPLSLPKSPSDSWLGRTLPFMSAKKSSLRPSLGAATNPTVDVKWNNIDRNVNIQRHSLCDAKELLMPIPEA